MLKKFLERPTWPTDLRSASAWLGDAIAIKDPTAAIFRTHSGNNLLIVGQNEEAALAIFAAALLGLAAQHDRSAEFLILDGTLDDDTNAGVLGKIAAAIPHPLVFPERNRIGEHLAALGTMVTARQKGEQADRSPRYVFIHGIQRFRDLRKEEEMGFGRRGASASCRLRNTSPTFCARGQPLAFTSWYGAMFSPI